MNGLILFAIFLGIVLVAIISSYFGFKQNNRWDAFISSATKELEESGFLINHSYRLINKTTNNVAYIRIISIKFSPKYNKVMLHAYMVTKNGEIGEWYDEYTHILAIKDRWDLEDCGEWNV